MNGNLPNSNLLGLLGMKMEFPEIFQGLVLESAAESGLARTVT